MISWAAQTHLAGRVFETPGLDRLTVLQRQRLILLPQTIKFVENIKNVYRNVNVSNYIYFGVVAILLCKCLNFSVLLRVTPEPKRRSYMSQKCVTNMRPMFSSVPSFFDCSL